MHRSFGCSISIYAYVGYVYIDKSQIPSYRGLNKFHPVIFLDRPTRKTPHYASIHYLDYSGISFRSLVVCIPPVNEIGNANNYYSDY